MILFFDTETTGLPKNWKAPVTDLNNWPRMVQLAYIFHDLNGNIISQGDYIIKPDGYAIPKDASDIHGITTEKAIREGKNLSFVLEEFNSLLNKAEYLVAHNISFDEKIVGAEFLRNNMQNPIPSKIKICTMESSTNYCAIDGPYGYKWPKLSELHFKLFNSDFEEAHNAMIDIKVTSKCFWELVDINVIKLENRVIHTEISKKSVLIPCSKTFSSGKKYYGYCDSLTKQTIIDFKFRYAFPFEGDYAKVNFAGYEYFLNNHGNLIGCADEENFKEGINAAYFIPDIDSLSISRNRNYGFINTKDSNLIVIPFEYEDAGEFSEGIAPVKRNGKWGYIDLNQNIKIPFEYDNAECFQFGKASVLKNGKWGKINNENIMLLPFIYDVFFNLDLNTRLQFFEINKKIGIIDTIKLSEVIPAKYEDFKSFSEGLACVKYNGFYGYIDKFGNEIIPFEFLRAENFKNGKAKVSKVEKIKNIFFKKEKEIEFYINKNGSKCI